MRSFVFYLIFMSFFLSLSGCNANYKDISSDSIVAQYIGQIYVLKNDMNMSGINLPSGYGENIDVYMVNKLYSVQHKAPEEITSDIFPKGATFTVEGVYECTNCLSFSTLRNVSIITNDFSKAVDVPVIMSMHEIQSEENVTRVE